MMMIHFVLIGGGITLMILGVWGLFSDVAALTKRVDRLEQSSRTAAAAGEKKDL